MIYIRKSGSEIELSDTKEMREFAASQGWQLKGDAVQGVVKRAYNKKEKVEDGNGV